MKVIDCFIFYNELTILDFRLKELNDVVDYFVLVESTVTHRGNPKPLIYNDNKERYSEYTDKIIHVIVDDMPTGNDNWKRENFQRECVRRGISRLNLEDTDIITVCDCDEIPDADTLKTLKETGINKPLSLVQDLYYYSPIHQLDYILWNKAKVLDLKSFNQIKDLSNQLRLGEYPNIKKGGWHFSYFGDMTFIKNKLREFAHSEHSGISEETIQRGLRGEADLFPGQRTRGKYIPIEKNPYLPKNIGLLLKFCK